MSYWNYRVVQHTDPEGNAWFGIHEVHYNDEDEINAITVDPTMLLGDSLEDIRGSMGMIVKAFTQDVLDGDNMPFAEVSQEEAEEIDGDV